MSFCRLIFTISFISLPGAIVAHPHVYIDAALGLVYDDKGDLTGMNVEWSYDDFYSLLIIEDYALDPDGDSVLTPEESDLIQGFDADWVPGSAGGLYVTADGKPVELEMPRDFTAEYRDGRLISRHFRPLAQPLSGDRALQIQIYDPEFYVDFSVPKAPVAEGRDCAIELIPGDTNAAPDAYRKAVEDALGVGTDTAEADIITVDIGSAGADEMRVNCGEVAKP